MKLIPRGQSLFPIALMSLLVGLTFWLQRATEKGGSLGDQIRVRRALGRWVLDRGDEAGGAASAGYCFVASETLYGLSAVR